MDSATTKPKRAVQFAEIVVDSTHQSSKKDLKICELVIQARRRRKESFERLQNVKQNLQPSRSLLQNSVEHENSQWTRHFGKLEHPWLGRPWPAGTPIVTSIFSDSGVLDGSTVLVSRAPFSGVHIWFLNHLLLFWSHLVRAHQKWSVGFIPFKSIT